MSSRTLWGLLSLVCLVATCLATTFWGAAFWLVLAFFTASQAGEEAGE